MGNYVKKLNTDMDPRVKRCIQTRLRMSKKFRKCTNVYSEHVS